MSEVNPTGDAGVSTLARIESFLAAQEGETQPQQRAEQAPPKEEQQDQAPPDLEASEVPEVETPEGDGDPGSEGPQVDLSDIARFLGVDESALDVSEEGAILVKTKVDGKEGSAKFQDLVKSYQLQGHVDAKAREAAETQKHLAERMQQFEQYAQAEAQRIGQLANLAHQELMRDAAQVDWEALARNDPAEYVAKQHEMNARQARVNQLVQEAAQQQGQWQQAQQMRFQQSLQHEAERLPTLIPEWSDAKVAEAEKAEMRAWMKGAGFSDQDVAGLTRADIVATLRKAMLYDKGRAKTVETEKKVRAAPKLVKPGQSADARQRAEEGVRNLKTQIRKSGGKSGIAEYLMATGKV